MRAFTWTQRLTSGVSLTHHIVGDVVSPEPGEQQALEICLSLPARITDMSDLNTGPYVYQLNSLPSANLAFSIFILYFPGLDYTSDN